MIVLVVGFVLVPVPSDKPPYLHSFMALTEGLKPDDDLLPWVASVVRRVLRRCP